MQNSFKLFRKIKYCRIYDSALRARSKAAIFDSSWGLPQRKEEGSKSKIIDSSDRSSLEESFSRPNDPSTAFSIKDEQLKKIFGLTENAFDLPSQNRYPSWLLVFKLKARDLKNRLSLLENYLPKNFSKRAVKDRISDSALRARSFAATYAFFFKRNERTFLYNSLRFFPVVDTLEAFFYAEAQRIDFRRLAFFRKTKNVVFLDQTLSDSNYKAIFRDESYFFNNFAKRLYILMSFLKSEQKILVFNIFVRFPRGRKPRISIFQIGPLFENNKLFLLICLKKIGFINLNEEDPKIFIRRLFRSISKKPSKILFKTKIKLGMISQSNLRFGPEGSKKPRRRGTHSKVQLMKKIIPEIQGGRLTYTIQSYLRTHINKLLARHKILTFIVLTYWMQKVKESKSEKRYEYL